MIEKGQCPKCGGVMEWKSVDFNPLNFLVFTGNPVVRARKCEKCGHEIGRTDSTSKKVPPPGAGPAPAPSQTSGSESPRPRPVGRFKETGRPTRHCPDCAEDIYAEATLCRFCGRRISAEEVAAAIQEIEIRQAAIEAARTAADQRRKLGAKRWVRAFFGGLFVVFGFLVTLLSASMYLDRAAPGSTAQEHKNAALIVFAILGAPSLGLGLWLRVCAARIRAQIVASQKR